MNDEDRAKRAELHGALLDAQSQWGDFVSALLGLASQLEANGWTAEQARAIVAYQWGWRPAAGTKPEGTS